MSENKEHEERGEGGWGGDWGRGEILDPGPFQSGLVSGVSVLQGSSWNLWRLLTRKDQWIRLWATWAQVLTEPNWTTFGIILEILFKNECLIVLLGLPCCLVFYLFVTIPNITYSNKIIIPK